MPYSARLEKIRSKLRRKRLDAVLISRPENRRYLSGYSAPDHGIDESSGFLFVPARGDAYLLTDFRFKTQAENDVRDIGIRLYSRGLLSLLKTLLPECGVQSLGFESGYMLHSMTVKMAAMAEKCGGAVLPLMNFVESMRLIKDEEEIEKIRRSVALNEKVFQKIYAGLEEGQTEREVALAIALTMREFGASRESFDTIVAAGVRSALPHAAPGEAKIQRNRPLMIDIGLVLDGYCSDMTRTCVFGKADDRYLEIHRLVRKAQCAGIVAVRAGAVARDADRAARSIIADAGMGKYFGHALGHGVGLAVHEEPRLSPHSRRKLASGMVVTVEPGVYIPGWGGVRLENMVVVREDGCENLNTDTTWLDI